MSQVLLLVRKQIKLFTIILTFHFFQASDCVNLLLIQKTRSNITNIKITINVKIVKKG